MTDFIEDVPAIAISYSMQAGGRNVVLQTGVSRDCKSEKLSELMDKLQGAADRVAAYEAIAETEKEMERETHQAWIVKNNIELLDSRYSAMFEDAAKSGRPRPKMEKDQLVQRENSAKTLAMHDEAIIKHMNKITELRAKLGFKA